MIKSGKKILRGIFLALMLIVNGIVFPICLLSTIAVNSLIKLPRSRQRCRLVMNELYHTWVELNYAVIQWLPTKWTVSGHEQLSPEKNYLVIANHRSWLDILVIQCVLNRRTTHNMFILKDGLRWLPFVGWVCWAMDYPFVKRVTPAQVRKNPALKYHDRDSINQACERIKQQPFTLVNFLEGTRFSESKQQKQQSPYQNLLSPNAAGAALTFNALSEDISAVLDITLIYDQKNISFWHFLQGKLNHLQVRVTTIDPNQLSRGDFMQDREYRKAFRQELNQIWANKDNQLNQYYARKS